MKIQEKMPTVCSTSKSKVHSLQGINHRKYDDKPQRKKIIKGEDEHVTWTLNPKYPKQKKEEQTKIVPNKRRHKQRASTSNYIENDVHNVTTKNKKVKLRNRTTIKTPSCGVQIMEEKAKKVDKNMKKATSVRLINFCHESCQNIDYLDRFVPYLLEREENNGDNNSDVIKELDFLKTFLGKFSYVKFIDENIDDICNRHGKDGDKKIFKANKSSSNKKKDSTSRICESTVTKGLHHSKSKKDDLTRNCVPASLDCTKVKKTKRSKTQTASHFLSDVYDYSLDTNLNKNTCKILSGTTKNPISHKMISVYKTEIKGCLKPSYDKQVKSGIDSKSMPKASNEKVRNSCSFNVNVNKKIICKTNMAYDEVNNEICDVYLDANSENATTIHRNNYENVVTEAENDDYSDYISWKTCSCNSKTEIEQFVETCDLVFDKFSDILFDTVKSDYNTNLQINATLKSTGEC